MKGLDPSRPLSLYIHVPFCRSKCDYCAFYSVPSSSYDANTINRYMRIILSEIDALNREWNAPYRTIFIGGGNPGMLGYGRISEILAKAEENGMPEEVSIEINPEDVTDDIYTLRPLLTRVSVGIQSMNERTLRRLGRNASVSDNERALSILSRSPFRWNADIITAVPGESVEECLSDIRTVASYGPGHISFYCLSFEEGTPLIARECPIGEEEEARFLEEGWNELRALGYEHYEISNFARNGEHCLHNEVYWDLGQYVGFGPGAEGSIGYSKAVSMRDAEPLSRFLSDPELSCTPLSGTETEEEYLLVALRTSRGICKESYRERFGKDFDAVYGSLIEAMDETAYLDTPSSFSLTEKGFLTLDWVILHLSMGI